MEEMAIMMDNLARITRYDFLVPQADRMMGLFVHGVGSRIAPPDVDYQIFEEGAPYQWEHGRTISDFALVYLTEGAGSFQTSAAKTIRVQAGDVLLLRPGMWHNYYPSRKTGWREYWVTLNGENAESLFARFGNPDRTAVLRPGIDPTLCQLFLEMLDTAKECPPHTNLLLSGQLLQVISRILGQVIMKKDGPRQEQLLVGQARKYIEEHFTEQINMPDLALSLKVSYRHFRRIFKSATGLAPHQYLLNIRIINARRLLEEKNIKISALAKMVGFDDAYYFSRIFKSKTGIAPANWRR